MGFVESLETRRMLSAAVHDAHTGHNAHHPALTMPKNAMKMSGRNLMIQGTKGDDVIAVMVNATDATKLDVTYNGVTKTVAMGRVKRIMVNAKAGNDMVTIDAAVTLRADLEGGAGNDSLTGGSGNDRLHGGAGVNQMTGGAGADQFNAHAASEVLDFDATQHDKMDLPPPPPVAPPAPPDGGA